VSAALLKLERFDPPALGPPEASEHDILIQQARAQAFSEGYATGIAAYATKGNEREKFIAAATAAIEAANASAPQRVQQEAVGAAKAVLEAVFPTLSRAAFAVEAANALASLAKTGGAVALEVRAPEEHAAVIEGLIKEIGGPITVKADEALTGAAATAVWQGGGVEFDLDRAAKECLAALERATGGISNGKQS
jgi:hypothetical protein